MQESDIPREFRTIHTLSCKKCGSRLTFYSDRRFQDTFLELLKEKEWLIVIEGKFLCSNCRLVAGAEN